MSTPGRTPSQASSTATSPTNTLRYHRNKENYLKGEDSDLRIICQGFRFDLHQTVVCRQSPYFAESLSTGHLEGPAANVINLHADDLETMERVFSYMYLKDYEELGHVMDINDQVRAIGLGRAIEGDIAPRTAGFNNIQVFLIADRFVMPRLKDLAATKFRQWCTANWDTDNFGDAIEGVMALLPEYPVRLLHILVDIITANMRAFSDSGKLLTLVQPYGTLGVALLHRMIEDTKKGERRHNNIVAAIANTTMRVPACPNPRCLAPLEVRLEEDDFELRTVRCAHCKERVWEPKDPREDPLVQLN
ncbi:hypothetical protein BDV12DRAFT_154351 [Aspergillus spectabilis]